VTRTAKRDPGSSQPELAAVPDHVVFRSFVNETVVLNLKTGRYHGINPVGGRILELLAAVGSLDAAATELACEFGRSFEETWQDVQDFCADLAERGLIELTSDCAR
jgi:hypothetical protein